MASSCSELEALAATHVREPIPAEILSPVLAAPPFIPFRSLVNTRDLGAVPGSAIAPGRIYRSGTLDGADRDPAAVAWLATHVCRVFDLRGADERAHHPSLDVPGLETVWLDQDGDYTASELAQFAADGDDAWRRQYMLITRLYKPTFRAILEHVRDRPAEPFLFHCTAGRDRTGVMAGLLHGLAGTAPGDTVLDYMLSRIGTEPAREKLVAFAMANLGVADVEAPGFWDMVSLRPSYWYAFLESLDGEYGGWDGYVTRALGFSATDLETVKRNLRAGGPNA